METDNLNDLERAFIEQHLIGVLDLRGGKAVHAVAGNRDTYKEIDRAGCRAGSPIELVESYCKPPSQSQESQPTFAALAGLYIADLDAIVDNKDESWSAIVELVQQETIPSRKLWLDRGMPSERQIDELAKLARSCQLHVVIGTESIVNWDDFVATCQSLAARSISMTVSIDLLNGQLQSCCPQLQGQSPNAVVEDMLEIGVSDFIVLDLKSVGTNLGPSTIQLCKQISLQLNESRDHQVRATGPDIGGCRLISGGGVRSVENVKRYLDVGCSAVLTATWLQNQWE